MQKIYILADSYKHYEIAIKEYEKRLGKNLEIIKLKASKKKEAFLAIKEDSENIIEKLKKENWYKIISSPTWKKINTLDFYNFIEDKKQNFWNIIFVIWWAYWLDYKLIQKHIDFELSLSDFTLPHSLALLVLVEQLYRIDMIKKWTDYNK